MSDININQNDKNIFTASYSIMINDKQKRLNEYSNKLSSALSSMHKAKKEFDDMIQATLQQTKEYKQFISLINDKCIKEWKDKKDEPPQDNMYNLTTKTIIENLITLNEWFALTEEEQSKQTMQSQRKSKTAISTMTKDEATKNFGVIINALGVNSIEDYYSNHLEKFLHLQYIYRITIQLPNEFSRQSNNFISNKELKWKTEDYYIRNNINLCKYVEISLIKRRRNSSIIHLVHDIRNDYYKNWLMRMDENYNVLIKGVLKDSYLSFENQVLTPCNEYKNLAYIHIKVYFSAIDMLGDYSNEYDKVTFKADQLKIYTKAYLSLEKVRVSALANKQNE